MKRIFKIVRKTVLGLVLAFAAFAGGDFAVRMLTQKSAPLTDEQREKAEAVFGNTLDYSKVRIAFGRISYFQPPGSIVTIGNTIHYPPAEPKKTADKAVPEAPKPPAPIITFGYSQPTMNDESDTFIHEMTHIWQNQHNIKGTGISGAVMLWAKGFLSSSSKNVYAYTLDSTKTLEDYNIEQQAKIVEAYSVIKKDMVLYPNLPVPEKYALLKKIVEKYIPPAAPDKKPGNRLSDR
jgi:hypothetical protein